jgi:hypothetical protein
MSVANGSPFATGSLRPTLQPSARFGPRAGSRLGDAAVGQSQSGCAKRCDGRHAGGYGHRGCLHRDPPTARAEDRTAVTMALTKMVTRRLVAAAAKRPGAARSQNGSHGDLPDAQDTRQIGCKMRVPASSSCYLLVNGSGGSRLFLGHQGTAAGRIGKMRTFFLIKKRKTRTGKPPWL